MECGGNLSGGFWSTRRCLTWIFQSWERNARSDRVVCLCPVSSFQRHTTRSLRATRVTLPAPKGRGEAAWCFRGI